MEGVGGGALAGYGDGGGRRAVDGEEERAVGDSCAGERNDGGEFASELPRVRVLLSAPRAVGAKVMVMVQVEPGASVVVRHGVVIA